VASIATDGVVTGATPGSTWAVARLGERADSARITVPTPDGPALTVLLDGALEDVLVARRQRTVSVQVLDEAGEDVTATIDSTDIRWSVEPVGVASVVGPAFGVTRQVWGVSPGTFTLTVTVAGEFAGTLDGSVRMPRYSLVTDSLRVTSFADSVRVTYHIEDNDSWFEPTGLEVEVERPWFDGERVAETSSGPASETFRGWVHPRSPGHVRYRVHAKLTQRWLPGRRAWLGLFRTRSGYYVTGMDGLEISFGRTCRTVSSST
jgi:hypothetical protein